MKKELLFMVLLFSCCLADNKEDKETSYCFTQATKPIKMVRDVEKKVQIQNADSLLMILKKINKCFEINYTFEENEIIEYEEFDLEKNKLFLIKLEPHTKIKALGNDPVINLIGFFNGKYYFNFTPSVYHDDFRFLKRGSGFIVFEYYSSSVGYTQLIVINVKSKEFFISERIQETETLILESINLTEKEFKVLDEKNNELKKDIKQSQWIFC